MRIHIEYGYLPVLNTDPAVRIEYVDISNCLSALFIFENRFNLNILYSMRAGGHIQRGQVAIIFN